MEEHRFETKYTRFENIEELNKADKELVLSAFDAFEKSYSPYSAFKVGAAIRLDNDKIVIGTNQENAAYPSGLCAERTALFASGMHDGSPQTIAIVAQNDKQQPASAYPCGACRQVMMETEKRHKNNLEIIVGLKDGSFVKFENTSSLLPFEFEI